MSISYIAAGTQGAATGNTTPGLPTGWAENDLLLGLIGNKSALSGGVVEIPGTPADWNQEVTAANGTTAAGTDTGSCRATIHSRMAVSGDAAPTVTHSTGTNNLIQDIVLAFRSSTAATWSLVSTSAADASSGTGFSATGSTIDITTGDYIVAVAFSPTDTGGGTISAVSLTVPGCTLGAATTPAGSTGTSTTVGGDGRLFVWVHAVTAGTATGGPTFAWSNSTSGVGGTGEVAFIRVRENPPITVSQNFDGGSAGTTITTANAGGTGNTQMDAVTIGTGSAVTFDSTHSHSGSLAAKCDVGTTPADAGFEWSTTVGPQTQWWMRAYYYATSNPPANHHRIFDITTAGGAALVSGVMHHTDGTLILLDGGFGIAAQTTTAIALNQWVRIEARFVGSAAAGGGQVELRLFNSPDSTTATETVSNLATNTSGKGVIFRFGFNGDTYDSGRVVWLDDIGVSSSTWLGPTAASTSAPAEQPAAAGTAPDASVAVTIAAGQPAGTGSAGDGIPAEGAQAGQPPAAGTAPDATVTVSGGTNAPAEQPGAAGSGQDATASVTAGSGQPAATGAAADASVAITVPAEQPTATGAGQDAVGALGGNAEQPTGSGSASAGASSIGAAPAAPAAVGTAQDSGSITVVVNAEQPTAAGAVQATTGAVGGAAESADAYGTHLYDGFAGLAPATWTDNVNHGLWYQTPSGNQTVKILDQSGQRWISVSAEPVGGGAGTFAGLALSRDSFSNWSTLAVEYVTDTQHRTPTPNRWEVGWVFFNFTDSNHFYYVLLCPDGYWELGKEWTDGVTQFQDFMVIQSGTPPVTWPLGDRLRVEIDLLVSGTSVTFNVRAKDVTRGDSSYQNLVTGFADDGTRPSGAAYLNGQLGLYVEDSAARFGLIDLDYPRRIQPSITAVSTTAAFAGLASGTGAANDAAVAIAANAEQTASTGAAQAAAADVHVSAGQPAATGAASDAPAAVAVNAEQPTAAGVANDATAATSSSVNASAEQPSAAGSAGDPVAALGALAEQPSTAGSAQDSSTAVVVNAEQPAAVGAASDTGVTTSTSVSAAASEAAGAGAGQDAVSAITTASEQPAAAAVAQQPTTAFAPIPEQPAASGASFDATPATAGQAEQPASAGSAADSAVAITAGPTQSDATGTAGDATILSAGSAAAEQPSAVGASQDPTASTAPLAAVPSATGTSLDAAANSGGAPPEASSAGSGLDPVTSVAVFAAAPSGVGSAGDSTALIIYVAPADVAVAIASTPAPTLAVTIEGAQFSVSAGGALDALVSTVSDIRPFFVLDSGPVLVGSIESRTVSVGMMVE